jgi:hypothetical protein
VAEISWAEDALAIWRVFACATPTVSRACATCGARRRFRSSDRFRVNAQQRRIDVWLVYRCSACDATWNLSVASRRTPEQLGADLVRFERNDPALARSCAFDRGLLARAGARADDDVPFRVDAAGPAARSTARGACARVALADPVEVRLERVIAAALRVSRSRVRAWAAGGSLVLHPDDGGALDRPARHGQRVALRGEDVR